MDRSTMKKMKMAPFDRMSELSIQFAGDTDTTSGARHDGQTMYSHGAITYDGGGLGTS